VGNDPECWSIVESLEAPNYSHIHGRFFMQAIEFLGLSSKKQVEACLSQYDTLRHPEEGPTYAECFLPEATKKGWPLAMLAEDFWRIFGGYKKTYKFKSWGMRYFTAAVKTLLTDFLPKYGVDAFDDEMLHACIRVSGLIPSLVRVTK